MGKFLTRSIVVILLGLSAYLYVKVVDLQRTNIQLAASITQMRSLQEQNTQLKAQLSQQIADNRAAQPQGWLAVTHMHIQAAEQAAARGDFAQAASESHEASATLSSAAQSASRRSRNAALGLHERIASLQTRAKTFWQSFGG